MTLRHPVRAIEKNGEKHVRWLFSPSLSLVFPATRAPPTHSTFHLIVVFFAATMKSCGKASSVSFLHFAFCRTSREVAPRGVREGCSRSYFNCEWKFSLCLLRLGFWLKVLHNGSSFGWIYYNLSWILICVARWKKGFGLNSYEMFSDLHRNVESCDDLHPKKNTRNSFHRIHPSLKSSRRNNFISRSTSFTGEAKAEWISMANRKILSCLKILSS